MNPNFDHLTRSVIATVATNSLTKSARRALSIAALFATLMMPLQAELGLPVALGMASADHLKPGEPVTVHLALESGADISLANFRLQTSTHWQILDGTQFWTGSLKAGEKLAFTVRAMPLTSDPEPLSAVLEAPGSGSRKIQLEAERFGNQAPEMSAADSPIDPDAAEIQTQDAARAVEPAPARLARVPGHVPPQRQEKAAKGQRAANATVRVTGRFTYLDDNDVRKGVRFATVEMVNVDPIPAFDSVCARSTTDSTGAFNFSATCGDLFDLPDIAVRIVLNNNVVEVKPDNLFAGSYTFRTGVRNNISSGTQNFGVITITSNRAAYQAHNLIMRAQDKMDDINENMSKVTVFWPSADQKTYYTPILSQIKLTSSTPFGEEGDVFHEYGHHVLITRAESPIPDYNNGFCDGEPVLPVFEGGHCLDKPEKGVISWTEGWPDFFAAVLVRDLNVTDSLAATNKYNFETVEVAEGFEGFEDKIESVIAAILLDLEDPVQAAESDNMNLTFRQMWEVIRDFDPSSSILHNHPTSIHEYWDGLRDQHLTQINRISEVYRANGIVKPQPDLRVTSIQNPPTAIDRGTTFSLNSIVDNAGEELVNSAFTVRYTIANVLNTANQIVIGTRTVPAGLGTGPANTGAATVTIPANTVPGRYLLIVCADTGRVVPESVETNNCRAASVTPVIEP